MRQFYEYIFKYIIYSRLLANMKYIRIYWTFTFQLVYQISVKKINFSIHLENDFLEAYASGDYLLIETNK